MFLKAKFILEGWFLLDFISILPFDLVGYVSVQAFVSLRLDSNIFF